ncbi:putative serine/threonine-protein kinase MPS1 like protein, partial [Nosema granulosis]
MEKFSKSKDLYQYLLDQYAKTTTHSQLLTLLMLAVQKNLDEDMYMLAINLSYILCLKEAKDGSKEDSKEDSKDGSKDESESRVFFSTMKMKYYKYLGFWREYISFEIEAGTKPIEKVLKASIKYIDLKDFKDKEKITNYLQEVSRERERGGSLEKYIRRYKEKFIKIEDLEETNKENFNNRKKKHVGGEAGYSPYLKKFPMHNKVHVHENQVKMHNENQVHEKSPEHENENQVLSQLKTPISEMSLSWNKKPQYLYNFKLEGVASPERKLKFSSYQSPNKSIKCKIDLPPVDDTLEIKNMLEEIRNSENFRRKIEDKKIEKNYEDKNYEDKNYEEKKIEKNYEEKKIEKNYEIKIEEKNEISH